MSGSTRHLAVMLSEVVAALAPADGEVFADGTFGGGGYSRAILSAAQCTVYGIDRDPDAIARGRAMEAQFAPRLKLVQGAFGDMADLLAAENVNGLDGVALDLGVSSDQIDRAERGFSFMSDGPLDMRMSAQGLSAADVVNNYGADEIANILWLYGEEKRSRAIAKAIMAARTDRALTRTSDLAQICQAVLGRAHDGLHPATRTFQALRIYVNDELGELVRGLSAAEHLLRPRGRLAVVSFHSLEDRIVKRFLADRSGRTANPSRHAPSGPVSTTQPSFTLITKGAQAASDPEARTNPRARSAKLRAAVRTQSPAIPLSPEMSRTAEERPS
jgi:16S rRNA (cytosine1402-N4)-methyltransferase